MLEEFDSDAADGVSPSTSTLIDGCYYPSICL